MSDFPTLSEGVSSSLSELERKLRLLERELSCVTNRPGGATAGPGGPGAGVPASATPAESVAAASPPAPRPPAHGEHQEDPSTVGLDLEPLVRFRDQLERYSRALVTDYGRLLAHLGVDVPSAPRRPLDSPPAAAAVIDPPVPDEFVGRGLLYEDTLLEGDVTLEVGPVSGPRALFDLEHELRGLPTRHVRVRAFEGGRAVFELRLEHPTRLVADLRQTVTTDFLLLDAAPRRVSIVLQTGQHGV